MCSAHRCRYCIGSLFDLFEKLERGYREDEIRALTFQTLSGLQFVGKSGQFKEMRG